MLVIDTVSDTRRLVERTINSRMRRDPVIAKNGTGCLLAMAFGRTSTFHGETKSRNMLLRAGAAFRAMACHGVRNLA